MPTQAEALYPSGPSQQLGNQHPADRVPEFDYQEMDTRHGKGAPKYELPKVTTDKNGLKVVEIKRRKENDLDDLMNQLAETTRRHGLVDGDKVLVHDKEGYQSWYAKDSRHDDPGFAYFSPPEPGV